MNTQYMDESEAKILIVDDKPENLRLLTSILKEAGYIVRQLRSGQMVLASVLDAPPDLILLDIMMPETDGYEVCRRLKGEERTRGIPVIFISALGDVADKIKGFSLGGVDYITKPFREEEVLVRVRNHLMLKMTENALRSALDERKALEERLREYSESLEEMVQERTEKLKKAQEELLLKERLAVLGHFAGSVSHELRNPLAAIDSAVYFLKMKSDKEDEKLRKPLDQISTNVKKATAIIQSLINLSRMEKPKAETLDVIDLVHETIQTSRIPDTIEVVTQFPDNRIFADLEKEQIRMALKNLINNAAQAMDDSGTLTVSARPVEPEQVEISIADTGPGISPEYVEKVFEPLFSTKTHGIGFGLSITRMIAENHGGKIRAASIPGSGAVFVITLPTISNSLKL